MKVFLKILILSLGLLAIGEGLKRSDISPHFNSYGLYSQGLGRVFKNGDSIAWSNKEYNASDWSNRKVNFDTTGVFWMREKFNIHIPPHRRKAVKISALASYDFYWDGILIGTNGKVGSKKSEEREGKMNRTFIIPDSLSNYGSHTLALRASNFYLKNKIRIHSIVIGPASHIYTQSITFAVFMHLLGGAFFIISIYYLFQYTNDKSMTSFLFGLLCLAFFLLIIFEYMKFYYNYPYSFHFIRLRIIEIITVCVTLLLPLFLISRFKIPRIKFIVLFMLIVICLIEMRVFIGNHDVRIRYLLAFSLIISTIIVFFSYFKKNENSENALVSVVPSFLIFYYYDVLLFISFFILIVFNLFSLSKHQKMINEEKKMALIQSARLEIDLIKKSIQPHFLMNTLTSIIEWIEQEPKKSIVFIEALAQEFKIITKMSNKKLVSINEELELCNLHLKIMNMRKDVKYIFDYSDINLDAFVPPGIFHTIIENGVSHSLSKDFLSFVLTEEISEMGVCYKIKTIDNIPETDTIIEGTGTKYIKARLGEAYGVKWSFSQNREIDGWASEIEIYN